MPAAKAWPPATVPLRGDCRRRASRRVSYPAAREQASGGSAERSLTGLLMTKIGRAELTMSRSPARAGNRPEGAFAVAAGARSLSTVSDHATEAVSMIALDVTRSRRARRSDNRIVIARLEATPPHWRRLVVRALTPKPTRSVDSEPSRGRRRPAMRRQRRGPARRRVRPASGEPRVPAMSARGQCPLRSRRGSSRDPHDPIGISGSRRTVGSVVVESKKH